MTSEILFNLGLSINITLLMNWNLIPGENLNRIDRYYTLKRFEDRLYKNKTLRDRLEKVKGKGILYYYCLTLQPRAMHLF